MSSSAIVHSVGIIHLDKEGGSPCTDEDVQQLEKELRTYCTKLPTTLACDIALLDLEGGFLRLGITGLLLDLVASPPLQE